MTRGEDAHTETGRQDESQGRLRAGIWVPIAQQQLQPSPRNKDKQGTHGTLLAMEGEVILTAPLLS